MWAIIGVVVVIGSVLGGYMPHGDVAALWQPLEVLIICGGAFGAFLVSNPKTLIFAVFKSPGRVLKGPPHNKAAYVELLTLLFSIFRLAKSKGMLALETHLENPEESALFLRIPQVHEEQARGPFFVRLFATDYHGHGEPSRVGSANRRGHRDSPRRGDGDRGSRDQRGRRPAAFGIVAAVLGVIVTMGSITEPPEILGKLIGGALVGTFLGILLAYGFVSPSGRNLEMWADADTKYY